MDVLGDIFWQTVAKGDVFKLQIGHVQQITGLHHPYKPLYNLFFLFQAINLTYNLKNTHFLEQKNLKVKSNQP